MFAIPEVAHSLKSGSSSRIPKSAPSAPPIDCPLNCLLGTAVLLASVPAADIRQRLTEGAAVSVTNLSKSAPSFQLTSRSPSSPPSSAFFATFLFTCLHRPPRSFITTATAAIKGIPCDPTDDIFFDCDCLTYDFNRVFLPRPPFLQRFVLRFPRCGSLDLNVNSDRRHEYGIFFFPSTTSF